MYSRHSFRFIPSKFKELCFIIKNNKINYIIFEGGGRGVNVLAQDQYVKLSVVLNVKRQQGWSTNYPSDLFFRYGILPLNYIIQ